MTKTKKADPALAVPCPQCGACVGEPCAWHRKWVSAPHDRRRRLAAKEQMKVLGGGTMKSKREQLMDDIWEIQTAAVRTGRCAEAGYAEDPDHPGKALLTLCLEPLKEGHTCACELHYCGCKEPQDGKADQN
jgi:hypothetical protein